MNKIKLIAATCLISANTFAAEANYDHLLYSYQNALEGIEYNFQQCIKDASGRANSLDLKANCVENVESFHTGFMIGNTNEELSKKMLLALYGSKSGKKAIEEAQAEIDSGSDKSKRQICEDAIFTNIVQNLVREDVTASDILSILAISGTSVCN